MSYLLRHGAKKHGLEINDDGYVKIADLMEMESVSRHHPSLKDILSCASSNDKKRFEVKTDPESEEVTLENGYIRAAQGHTMDGIEEEKLLSKIEFPYSYPNIIHGTYNKVLDLIQDKGLCKMQRNHIHFAKGYAGDRRVISGMRSDCNVFIEVNIAKAIADEINVFESSNGVVLTAGIEGYLPPKYFRKILNKSKELIYSAPFDYIVVFDFECTCDDKKETKFNVQEIIEFPAVVIDVKEQKIIKAFQTYVKPSEHPDLTDFWTELTGITQDQVDGGVPIETALALFHNFLKDSNVLGSEFILMSWGDFDGKALKKEAEYKNLFVPSYLKEWINIKKAFPISKYTEEEVKEEKVTNVRNVKGVVRGMTDMLEKLGLELLGRHHSGIDDSFNIARWILKTLEDGHAYTHNYIDGAKYETHPEKLDEFFKNLAEIEQLENTGEIDSESHLEMMKESTEKK